MALEMDPETGRRANVIESDGTSAPEMTFRRGDCNDDGRVNLADAVCILGWLFESPRAPGCVAATNTNGDASSDVSDPVYLLNHLFAQGPAPLEPYPGCGPSSLEVDKQLGCETHPAACVVTLVTDE